MHGRCQRTRRANLSTYPLGLGSHAPFGRPRAGPAEKKNARRDWRRFVRARRAPSRMPETLMSCCCISNLERQGAFGLDRLRRVSRRRDSVGDVTERALAFAALPSSRPSARRLASRHVLMSSSSDCKHSSGFSVAGVDMLALALAEPTSDSSAADSDAPDADVAGLEPDPDAAAAAVDAVSGDSARFSSLAGGSSVAGPTSCHAGRASFFRFSRTGADFFFSARSTASASRTTEGVRARGARAASRATPSSSAVVVVPGKSRIFRRGFRRVADGEPVAEKRPRRRSSRRRRRVEEDGEQRPRFAGRPDA